MTNLPYLNPDEIKAWRADEAIPQPDQRHDLIRQRLVSNDLWIPKQTAGKRWAIGCVALEITQRCNLDCSLCYLSEHSQAVNDLPLEEIFRRVDLIFAHYGPNTDVQVTGGDPTLRERRELIAIVRYITAKGMRASLFTNGILATRELLTELSHVGLVDVAFHVDMTQGRKGYRNEQSLNEVRSEYIERARGLKLSVIFNTTLFSGNYHEVPELARFFASTADVVSFASFQLQADTGRGVLRERSDSITIDNTIAYIEQGAGIGLSFDTLRGGHHHCNRYAFAFVINGKLYDALDDPDLAVAFMNETAHIAFDRRDRGKAVLAAAIAVMKKPTLWLASLRWCARLLWRARNDLLQARGKIQKLSFFVHNFMDACHLERDRIESCIFMTITNDGPISMCMHNAKRDDFILKPIKIVRKGESRSWNPRTGKLDGADVSIPTPHEYPLTLKRGRTRQTELKERAKP
jgi:7,8-dihydro-6-hydroxymethylpterin dimethyltransferase